MLKLKWLACISGHLLAKLFVYPTAPFVCWLFATPNKRHLRAPFTWMETTDWDMAGDDAWREKRIAPGSDPLSLWNRTRWLWRNGAQALSFGVFGVAADRMVASGNDTPENPPYGTKLTLGYQGAKLVAFYWNHVTPSTLFGRHWQLRTGWMLGHDINGRYKVCLQAGAA